MSFGGHAADMLRREKDNRELRRNLRQRQKDALSNSILGKKIDYQKLSSSELENITKQIEEKAQTDRSNMMKDTMKYIIVCLIMAAILFIVLKLFR